VVFVVDKVSLGQIFFSSENLIGSPSNYHSTNARYSSSGTDMVVLFEAMVTISFVCWLLLQKPALIGHVTTFAV
jgi:hypothetical protein